MIEMRDFPHINLHIKSDGTPGGTEVRVGDTVLGGVTAIEWRIVGPDQLPEVTLRAYAGSLDVVVPVEVKP